MFWHYWSDTYCNEAGEDLQTCLEKYGTGGYTAIDDQRDWEVRLLFLDARRSDSKSWCLWIRKISTGTLIPVRLSEEADDTYRRPGLDVLPYCDDATRKGLEARLCSKCGYIFDRDLLMCGGCHRVRYCSVSCQKSDRRTHKESCVAKQHKQEMIN